MECMFPVAHPPCTLAAAVHLPFAMPVLHLLGTHDAAKGEIRPFVACCAHSCILCCHAPH